MRGLLFSQNSSAYFPGTSLPNIQRQIWSEPHLCFVPGREPSHRQCHPDRSGGICSCFSTLSPPRMPSFPIALTEPLQAAKRRLVLEWQHSSSRALASMLMWQQWPASTASAITQSISHGSLLEVLSLKSSIAAQLNHNSPFLCRGKVRDAGWNNDETARRIAL